MSKLRLVFFPFSIIYDGITRIKNYLYTNGILKSHSFSIPIIVIGNLSVGGTGKTPHTEYISRLLKNDYITSVLSRGYGRKTKGYLLATKESTAQTIGDEPLQIFQNITGITVAVCEDRSNGVNQLLADINPQVVILDDAFQHRKIQGSLYILLTTYDQPFYKDFVLPAGNLRETSSNKDRADIIIITKSPKSLSTQERDQIISSVSPTPSQKVFFSSIGYQDPIGFNTEKWDKNAPVLLVTGIVNPHPIQDELEKRGHSVTLLSFNDHHTYQDDDLKHISKRLRLLGENAIMVTTSKDAAKLKPLIQQSNHPITGFEIPIQIEILFGREKEFQNTISTHVKNYGN